MLNRTSLQTLYIAHHKAMPTAFKIKLLAIADLQDECDEGDPAGRKVAR